MRWIRVSIFVMIALLCIPRTVQARETGAILYYSWDKAGEAIPQQREFEFLEDCTTEGKVKILFYSLCYRLQEAEKTYVPQGTRVLEATFQEGVLTLNLSEEAKDCFGGEVERLFSQQILQTVYSIPEIQDIIVLVNGEKFDWPEGTDFLTKAEERAYEQNCICYQEQGQTQGD